MIKSKQILALCMTSIMSVGFLIGCGKSTVNETSSVSVESTITESSIDKDAIIKIASPQSSQTLDPVNGYDYWYLVRYGVCETLMGFNDDMTPYSWLVDKYEMDDDQLTWKFIIKDNVTFSNGNKLTAEIAKKCMERAFKDSNTAATYFSYDYIKADGQVLTIKTSSPTPTLPYILADPVFVMYDISEDISECAEKGVIGTGPFVVKSFDSVTGNTSVIRNDKYWNGSVECAGVDFKIVTDTTTMNYQMQNGEVDATYAVSFSDIGNFENNDSYKVLTVPSGRTDYCFMNENTIFKDVELRQAVSCALDKENYCSNLLSGQFVVGKTPLTSALPYGYDELKDSNAYDVEKANKLLDDAGYKDTNGDGIRETPEGKPLTISLTYYEARAEIPVIAQAMQINLKDIGIELKLNQLEQGTVWNLLTNGEYDMLIMSISMTSSGDPQTQLNSYFTTYSKKNKNYNKFGYSNKNVDSLMQELSVEFDLTKRQEIIKKMEQEIMNDSAIISLCYPVLNFVTNDKVTGITSHASDFYWISKDTCKLK